MRKVGGREEEVGDEEGVGTRTWTNDFKDKRNDDKLSPPRFAHVSGDKFMNCETTRRKWYNIVLYHVKLFGHVGFSSIR